MDVRTENEDRARYEVWMKELEARRNSLWRSQRVLNVGLVVALVLSLPVMVWSRWLALALAGFFLIIVLAGRYLIFMYRWQYALQIERTKMDIEKLDHLRAFPEERERPQDADDEERARYAAFRIPRQAVMRMPWQR